MYCVIMGWGWIGGVGRKNWDENIGIINIGIKNLLYFFWVGEGVLGERWAMRGRGLDGWSR
jgi:hypothetical protein